MNNVEIIRLTQLDAEALQKISKQTFMEAFASGNTEENMNKYLEDAFSLNKLKDELINENSKFFFAIINNNTVGYIKLNTGTSQTEIQDHSSLEIERIYVLKEYYGKNIAQVLYKKALAVAKETAARYIWLGVWEENQRAINFYKKNGFVEFDKHIFKLGDDEQTDIMMKLSLQ